MEKMKRNLLGGATEQSLREELRDLFERAYEGKVSRGTLEVDMKRIIKDFRNLYSGADKFEEIANGYWNAYNRKMFDQNYRENER